MKLTMGDFRKAAEELDCEVAAIRAVAYVESNGSAFLQNGQPKILFESHIFSELTKHRYDITHPRISTKTWSRNLYLGGEREHSRLQAAVHLDREAALQATSWGMFQILGRNWKACGFDSLQDFINAMYAGEEGQLAAFIGFIKHEGLARALQDKNWKLFARKYNGPGYWRNKYDKKMEQAYKEFLH